MIKEVPYDDVLSLRHEVMYPEENTDYVKLPDDNLGLHMGYYLDGDEEPICVVSLFLKGRDLQFRKFATKAYYQNRGYGSEMLRWIIDYAKDVKLEKVWCNAREGKTSFYEKSGFLKTDNTFVKGNYTYIIMEKRITD
jgi:Acetyltransferase (GNAT) family.